MKIFIRVSMLLVVAMLMLVVLPIGAQEEAPAGFAEGAPIIEPNFGDDIKTLNPVIVQDGSSNRVIARLFPTLIDFDPFTLQWEPGTPRGLAESWEISEDGTVYTFQLKDNYFWSDGTQVTADDLVWFWEASESEDVQSPNATFIAEVDNMVAVDDFTLEVTFGRQTCTALDILNPVTAVPAHFFEPTFGGDLANMESNPNNLNMPVSGLDFQFANFRPGEQVTLLASDTYPEAIFGHVIPEGWVFKTVTDQVVQMEQFFAGDLTWVSSVPQSFQEEVKERTADGEFQIFAGPSTTIRFLAFNTADPENPQSAFDDDGNLLDQGVHPVLGDVRVRQALAHAIDFEALNEGAFFGAGVQTATHSLPQSWANPGLQPFPLDLERAQALLEEAGWTDSDGDGVRECNGCETAEPGTTLSFRLETNAGNVSQEALYTILQDQWNEIGFDIEFAAVEFNTLVDALTSQTFDAIGLFWGFSIPDNPDDTADVFGIEADVLGAGFNVSSYHNERVDEILEEARTLPGCDQATRADLYGEMFEILRNDVPWLWISASTVYSVAQADLQNWDPQPGDGRWNIDGWFQEASR